MPRRCRPSPGGPSCRPCRKPPVRRAQPVSERLPVVPDVVRQVLTRVANQPAILLEALTLIRRAGLRLPPELVPGLLDDARAEVVAATRPVAGRDRPAADDEEPAVGGARGAGPGRPHRVGRGDLGAAGGVVAGAPPGRPGRRRGTC